MKKTQSGFALVEGLLIILILAIIGFGGYYVWHTQKTTDKTNADTLKASQTTPVRSNNDVSTDTELIASTIANKCHEMSPSITAAKVKAVLLNNYSSTDTSLKIDGNYASAPATCAESSDQAAGGFATLLKKNSGQWTIVFQGQQDPTCDVVDGQGWPSDLNVQCIDISTSEVRDAK